MKNALLLLLVLAGAKASFAQVSLNFNRKMIDAIDRYVVAPMSAKDSTYSLLFVYVDDVAGLTVNLEGTFKLKSGNITDFVKQPIHQRQIIRISPQSPAVAVFPEENLPKLGLEAIPFWLETYNSDVNGLHRKFRLGFINNQWGRAEKSLTYLNQVHEANPEYRGLSFERAFAYNVLQQYDKAISILESAIGKNPKDCLLYKELSYAQLQTGNLNKASEVAKYGFENCPPNIKFEIARNLMVKYFNTTNKEELNYWVTEVKKIIPAGNPALKEVEKLEADYNKKQP